MDQSSLPENEDVGVSENRGTQIFDDFLVLQIPSEKVLRLLKQKNTLSEGVWSPRDLS